MKHNKANESDPTFKIESAVVPKEIKRFIEQSVYCEINLDDEELNPFKPVTIPNMATSEVTVGTTN